MKKYTFLFDLDSTITKEEILPMLSQYIGKQKEMRKMTEEAMKGNVSFETSFLKRVQILSSLEVSYVRKKISQIPVNEEIAKFIMDNKSRCYVVTGNLDIWICELLKKIGMENHVFCSKADVYNDKIINVYSIVDKKKIAQQFKTPIVTIGDGDNDVGMAQCADIAIGFGGVRDIAPALMDNIDYAFYSDRECANFLRTLL